MNLSFSAYNYFFDFLSLAVLSLPLYFLLPSPVMRRCLLTGTGMYLLYFIAPRLLLFYLVFWGLVFLLQNLVARFSQGRFSSPLLLVTIAVTLAPMLLWKIVGDDFVLLFNLITDRGIKLFSEWIWEIDLIRKIIIPVGISFATFRAIDLLIKTYVGRISKLTFDRVFFFGFYPPVQIVGPIIEYEEIQRQGDALYTFAPEDILEGSKRIASGFFKIFLLAFWLRDSTNVFELFDSMQTWKIWVGLIMFTWYFYLNFSGYSDIAIGAARLFGYVLKENFSYPYFKRNIQEFWNNWHMSLTRFAQRNIFVPSGGYRPRTQYRAILATMMVIALWHDITWPLVLFGLCHGVGLIVHRIYLGLKGTATFPQWHDHASRLITYLFVTISFPLLFLPINKLTEFYLAMIGLRG
jgi:D-alanyl-lipoteichoic acid acyltransferase DltB (MBOAT superfamily)